MPGKLIRMMIGWHCVGEQRQKDKLDPLRKIVEPPLFKPVHNPPSPLHD